MPQNFHMKVFKAGLSLIVNTCSMKKCPQIGEWIRKVLYIHIVKYCLAMFIHSCNNMDGSPKRHVEWKNSESK